MIARLPIVFRPSFEKTSFSHALPAGGTTANFLLPIQKTSVATNIIDRGHRRTRAAARSS